LEVELLMAVFGTHERSEHETKEMRVFLGEVDVGAPHRMQTLAMVRDTLKPFQHVAPELLEATLAYRG
jgi:hypothetical protein